MGGEEFQERKQCVAGMEKGCACSGAETGTPWREGVRCREAATQDEGPQVSNFPNPI